MATEFEVFWLDWKGDPCATETVSKRDLGAAISWAGIRLANGRGGGADAHGVFVHSGRLGRPPFLERAAAGQGCIVSEPDAS